MPSWSGDGKTGGYIRIVDTLGSRPAAAVYDLQGILLASAGSVDTNTVLRFQYDVTDYTLIAAFATINFDAADVAAHPGQNLTVSYFFAPASAFGVGVVPTPDQIRLAALGVARASTSRTTAGVVSAVIIPTPAASSAFAPNQKWWLLVVPTAVASMASTPSIANDVPVGTINTIGRAVSVWTNRTPAAPTILAPTSLMSVFAGSEVTLTFKPNDPDAIASFPGDTRRQDFDDVAGVQIQYRPEPTDEDPDPAWVDMPITNTLGTATNRGWYIKRSATEPANDGAKTFWETYSMKIRCGAPDLVANRGVLVSGNWQVRVRTFDFGHPFPSSISPDVKPLNDPSGTYTPDSYPATNTSPWSTPVTIRVSSLVPAPIPLSPVGGQAIVKGDAFPLTWQYRNARTPPLPQAFRTVRLRKVGDPVWTTLISGAGSDSSIMVEDVGGSYPGAVEFPFEAGFQYEWQVTVIDSGGADSEPSSIVRFWIVPVPGSGGTRPLPTATIEGATLGCGKPIVEIYRRGGLERVGVLDGLAHVDWERVRDGYSTSEVIVTNWSIDCGNLLASLQTWAYEVVIWRDNGFSRDRVWEGPITLLTYEVDKVTIDARDVIAYPYRRILKQALNDTGDGASVVDRAARVLLNSLADDDPNVLPYLQVIAHLNDAKQYRSTPAYSRTAFEEIDDLAANAGLDYTAVGRSILVWGTKNRIGLLPEMNDTNLGSPPIVSEYGMSLATRYAVSDGNGIWGEATRPDASGKDPAYGAVEMLSSTWATETADETGTYTQAGLETVKASFAESSERSIASRYPPPVVVRVPDNTSLSAAAVLSIQDLVPGVAVPLRSTGTLREVVAIQKLDKVKTTWDEGTETVQITLSPFPSGEDDEEVIDA